MSMFRSNRNKCRHCFQQKKEPLIRACHCDHKLFHYSCLRRKIIQTADQKCNSCKTLFRNRRIKRQGKRETNGFIHKRTFFKVLWFLYFIFIWMVTRKLLLFFRDNSCEELLHKQKVSPNILYSDEDVCPECLEKYSQIQLETQYMANDWKALLLQTIVSLVIVSFCYWYCPWFGVRAKANERFECCRTVVLEACRPYTGSNCSKVKLFINKNEVLVEEVEEVRDNIRDSHGCGQFI